MTLCLFGSGCEEGEATPFARAMVIEGLDEVIGGPKAAVQPGDIIIENDQVRFGILGLRNDMGPGLYGGSIMDADLQRPEVTYQGGHGLDQLAEVIPTFNMNLADPSLGGSVSILADGSDGGAAIVRVEGPAVPFLSLLGALWALVKAPDYWMTTDYILEPGDGWLTLRSTAHFGEGIGTGETEDMEYGEGGLPLLEWGVETGLVGGDFYLSGGNVDVFGPGIGFDEDGAVYEAMAAGSNIFAEPFEFPFLAGVADGISYGMAPVDGNMYVPLFTASQTALFGAGKPGDGTDARFEPGSEYTYERYLFVGNGDVGSIVDSYLEARDIPHGHISGQVIEEWSHLPLSGADVFVYEVGNPMPWSQWRTDVDVMDDLPDGSFSGDLPVGDWELAVHIPGRADRPRVFVSVEEEKAVHLVLEATKTSTLSLSVTDEMGRHIPAKVTLFHLDGPSHRQPALGDSFIGGDPESVLFLTHGQGYTTLPEGTYQAMASRGVEYEIDISEPFEVRKDSSTDIQLQVWRSVNTAGWVSADLHVHGHHSHDSGVSMADRVRTMACEGVEFFVGTDHDFIVDYAPTIEQLDLEDWLQSAVGNETTTLEVGHFLAFPLEHDFLLEAGGGLDWTGLLPWEIVDGLQMQGESAGFEPFVFVGHPRDGLLGYFDQYGFDPYSGTPGVNGNPGSPTINSPLLSATNPLLKPANFTWDFDGLELLNGKRLELVRTPTRAESEAFSEGGDVSVYDMLVRTMEEQEALTAGSEGLAYGIEGQLDDWFSLLNLGFRYTGVGNSDTHGLTTTESGCPRNFVMSDTDEPSLLDDQAMADAIREHRVVASYGPFVQFFADGHAIGSEFIPEEDVVTFEIDVQAPSWIDVDRIEFYENGVLVKDWSVEDSTEILRFDEVFEWEVTKDSWYLVVVMGDGDMSPVFTPVEIPYVELQMIITEALAVVDAVSSMLEPAVPMPRQYPVHPFAFTNPIWIDVGESGFNAPGLPQGHVQPAP